jgi:ATP synthase protein I
MVAAAIAFGFVDLRAAWSAAIGGLISTVATTWFAVRVFAKDADAPLKQIVQAFYVGETQKLLLTALMFIVVIKWLDVSFLPLFLTYIVTLFVYWGILPFSLESW